MSLPVIKTSHGDRTRKPEFRQLLRNLKRLPPGKSLLFPIPPDRVRVDTLMVQIREFGHRHGFTLKASLYRPDKSIPQFIEISIKPSDPSSP